jgi:hypothetical protein
MYVRVSCLGAAKEYGLDEGAVGTVVDTDRNMIVAFVEGQTFSVATWDKLDRSVARYEIKLEAPDDKYQVAVWGLNLRLVFLALGLGSDYEAEWGDHRGFLEALQDPDMCREQIAIYRVVTEPIASAEICAIAAGILKKDGT